MRMTRAEYDLLVAKMARNSEARRRALEPDPPPAPKTDYRAEAALQRLIYSWLRQRGYEVGWARTDKRSRYTEGWPDFTFAVQRQAVGIEVKVPGGKLSDEQISTHMAMRKNGWEVRVCWSLEEVIDYVTDLELKQ